jgi:AcrR family transcriptional regulator
MNPVDTKTRILDAAERLFAENGIAATSLRAITAAAGANLAAVNYHFQSKEALIHACCSRRLGPANERRLAMLDDAERRAGDGVPSLEEIVRAFTEPFLRDFMGQPFVALMGRMIIEPGDFAQRLLAAQMGEIARRFSAAMRRALPGLPEEDMYWRMFFAVGVLAHTLAKGQLVEVVSQGRCRPGDIDAVVKRMATFLCAGLRAETGGHA